MANGPTTGPRLDLVLKVIVDAARDALKQMQKAGEDIDTMLLLKGQRQVQSFAKFTALHPDYTVPEDDLVPFARIERILWEHELLDEEPPEVVEDEPEPEEPMSEPNTDTAAARTCTGCGADISALHWRRKKCFKCQPKAKKKAAAAPPPDPIGFEQVVFPFPGPNGKRRAIRVTWDLDGSYDKTLVRQCLLTAVDLICQDSTPN